MEVIPHYKNRAVRDLAWSLFGPNMINHFPGRNISASELELTPKRRAWLNDLDQNPEPLLTHLEKLKTRRLGLYFEALWHFFLQQDEHLELVAHNLPIRDATRTLGELDLIYRDTVSDRFTHLELAVKFYLNTKTAGISTDPVDFLGPNGKDRLDIKLDRLLNHQSPLSDIPEAKPTLQDLGIDCCERKIALKGRLFYPPPFHPADNHFRPLSPLHQVGRWQTASNFFPSNHNAEQWIVLDKSQWLSPPDFSDSSENTLIHSDELRDAIADRFDAFRKPVMVCALNPAVEARNYYFITPNEWPEINDANADVRDSVPRGN